MARAPLISWRSAGFTLVEIIVTLTVGAVLFGLGSIVISNGFRTYFVGREILTDASQARLALERMTRELRAVRSATAADLDIGTGGRISFTDFNGTNIVYRQTGNTIERSQNGVIGTYQPLADNIDALTLAFTYLRSDGVTAEATGGNSTLVYYITVSFAVKSTNANAAYRGTVKPIGF